MSSSKTNVRGMYLIGAYLCILALMLISEGSMTAFIDIAKWLAFPLLIIFFYINTAIDSKFEKNIFYGISLFTMSSLLPLAQSVLGEYTNYIVLAMWIIAYFSYSRAIISMTNGYTSLLFRKKWLAGLLLIMGLVGIYFFIQNQPMEAGSPIPWLCLGLASLFFLLAVINSIGQLSPFLYGLYIVGATLAIGHNCMIGLKFSPNISIFEESYSILFYLGHLLIIFAVVKSCLSFRTNDYSDISSALTNKLN